MKKICLFAVTLMLVGCSDQSTTSNNSESLQAQVKELQKENKELKEQINVLSGAEFKESVASKTEKSKSNVFDKNDIKSKLEVKEYSYINSRNNYQFFLVITNNSDSDISLTSNLTTKDSDGNLLGAKSADVRAFERGSTICLSYYLDDQPATYEYEFDIGKESFKSVLSSLSYETSIAKDKAIVSVTNNGEIPAKFVEYTCMFFKDDVLVGMNSGYATDDDSELKPGKTINKEARSFTEFDSIKVYLTGRG
uniref:hypothetical protein n=1 Tax=Clostridium sp. 12(A) TaxID=1163671 RepID=UPI000463E8E8|nr:hypothetical protein [Clostridium sp. 12(A)]